MKTDIIAHGSAERSSSIKSKHNGDAKHYGIKSVKSMKTSKMTKYNSRVVDNMTSTYDYFLEEVDPLIGECVSTFLVVQPRNAIRSMLKFFKNKLKLMNSDAENPPEDLERIDDDIEGRVKVEQKIYLASTIGPIIAKLINKIALTRPKPVLNFICEELEAIIAKSEKDPFNLDYLEISKKPPVVSNTPLNSNQISLTRSKIENAINLDNSWTPLPDYVDEKMTPSSARSRLQDAKKLDQAIRTNRPETAPLTKSSYAKKSDDHLDDDSRTQSPSNVSSVKASPRSQSSPSKNESHTTAVTEHSNGPQSTDVIEMPKEKQNIRVAVLGLDGSGKTSILNRLTGISDGKVRPTVGFRPISMTFGDNADIKFFDLGGGAKIRDIWAQYYNDVHAFIFVFDASLGSEMEAHQESLKIFHKTISHELLKEKPLLIIANKQDLSGAFSAEDMEEILDIARMPEYKSVYQTVAGSTIISSFQEEEQVQSLLDPRIESGIEWLIKTVQNSYDKLNKRVQRDSAEKAKLDAKKRIERERKVLKNKIIATNNDKIPKEFLPDEIPVLNPEDQYSEEEGIEFFASEIGEDKNQLPDIALKIIKMINYQRLPMQIIGALKTPISKKKTPMSWDEIYDLIVELRTEVGLSAEC